MNQIKIYLIPFLCFYAFKSFGQISGEVSSFDENSIEIKYLKTYPALDTIRTDFIRASLDTNPARIIIEIDKDFKGPRHENNKNIFGDEYANAWANLNKFLKEGVQRETGKLVFDSEEFFKLIYYGEFSKIPKDWKEFSRFENLHNSFLYYSYKIYGQFYPSMLSIEFTRTITPKRRTLLGGVEELEPYVDFQEKIKIPYKLKEKYILYGNTLQIAYDSYDLDIEYVVFSFLTDYGPQTDVFKQMMQNIYRYSMGLNPVKKKEELNQL